MIVHSSPSVGSITSVPRKPTNEATVRLSSSCQARNWSVRSGFTRWATTAVIGTGAGAWLPADIASVWVTIGLIDPHSVCLRAEVRAALGDVDAAIGQRPAALLVL